MQPFALIPYPANELPDIKITGEIERTENQLSLRYRVSGNIASILMSEAVDVPTRRHDLWKMTCFEFFIAPEGQTQYWEFNLSPSGNWNVYHMDAYRQVNMREEPLFTTLPFIFHNEDKASLEISVDLSRIISANQKINIGIASIIQTRKGSESFWALAHPGSQADFHQRDGFTIQL